MRIGYAVRAGAASLAVLIFGQACAVRAPQTAPTAAPGRTATWQDEGAFSIGAEAYAEPARQLEDFGAHPRESILLIQLSVVSRALRPATLSRRRMALELPNGTRLSPVEPADVAGPDPRSESFGGGGGGNCVFLLPLCAVALAGLVGALVGGLVGVASTSAREAAYQARIQDYDAKSFPAVAVLETGRPAKGVVFFRLPKAWNAEFENGPRVLNQAVIERAKSQTFDGESENGPRVQDYTPPPLWQRATVTNLAGSSPRPAFVLHVEIEDGPEATAKSGNGTGAPPAARPAGMTRLHLPLRLNETPGHAQ